MQPQEKVSSLFEAAIRESFEILRKDSSEVGYEEIHDVKSWIYVAIERLGMKIEKYQESQRLLRELLSILNLRGGMKEEERKAGLKILGLLMKQGLPLRQIARNQNR